MKPQQDERERPLEIAGRERLAEEEASPESEFMLGAGFPAEDERQARASSLTARRKFYLYLTTSPQAEIAYRVTGVLCALVAAALLWRGQTESAFVVATLGVVAWFLGLRNRLRRAGIVSGAEAREGERRAEEDES